MGSSADPSLVNNVDELGLVYYGLIRVNTNQSFAHMGIIKLQPFARPQTASTLSFLLNTASVYATRNRRGVFCAAM